MKFYLTTAENFVPDERSIDASSWHVKKSMPEKMLNPCGFFVLLILLTLTGCRERVEHPSLRPVVAVSVIPMPAHIEPQPGQFYMTAGTRVIATGEGGEDDAGVMRIAESLSRHMKAAGLAVTVQPGLAGSGSLEKNNLIILRLNRSLFSGVGAEGYELSIDPSSVEISAAHPAGLFYGLQTLLQLMPADVFADQPSSKSVDHIALPCLRIVDKPRYSWRGFMLDCCRHFFPKEFIKKCLDLMALHKLNRFHWHLTEDQGWRIEIKKYPELTRIGAFRTEVAGNRSGGFYTQDDVRDIVAYAAERHIMVIPEIEMPGHSTAAIAAYPELSCTGGPFEVSPQWGVFKDVYCVGNDHTLEFLENVLDEVISLFPSPYLHIGGDECPKERWEACPRCRARMAAEGLKDGVELQSWFTRRIEAFLTSRNRQLIGWDEILEGGLAPRATVQSWRGKDGGIAAARQGHDVIMSPTSHCYFDYYQGRPEFEPLAIGGDLPLSYVYTFEPTPAELSADEARHILGGQANLWTEYIADPDHAEYMMFPRLCALAEALWSESAARDWGSFILRLEVHQRRLEQMSTHIAASLYRPIATIAVPRGKERWEITLKSDVPAAHIRYTLDGRDPDSKAKEFIKAFHVRRETVLKAGLFRNGRSLGLMLVKIMRRHKAAFKPVKLSLPNMDLPEGDASLLTDGLRGSLCETDSHWLGIEGNDLYAIIDLGKSMEVRRICAGFLQRPPSAILLPSYVEFAVSTDGRNFKPVAIVNNTIPDNYADINVHDFKTEFAAVDARFIRIHARNIGVCPTNHINAGEKAWLEADEIIVE